MCQQITLFSALNFLPRDEGAIAGRSCTTLAKSWLSLYFVRKSSNSSSGTFALIAFSNFRAHWLMTFLLL